MRDLTIAMLTVVALAGMLTATVLNGSAGSNLGRAEGYSQPSSRMLDIALAQLGSTYTPSDDLRSIEK
jgi:hypothetical protein